MTREEAVAAYAVPKDDEVEHDDRGRQIISTSFSQYDEARSRLRSSLAGQPLCGVCRSNFMAFVPEAGLWICEICKSRCSYTGKRVDVVAVFKWDRTGPITARQRPQGERVAGAGLAFGINNMILQYQQQGVRVDVIEPPADPAFVGRNFWVNDNPEVVEVRQDDAEVEGQR